MRGELSRPPLANLFHPLVAPCRSGVVRLLSPAGSVAVSDQGSQVLAIACEHLRGREALYALVLLEAAHFPLEAVSMDAPRDVEGVQGLCPDPETTRRQDQAGRRPTASVPNATGIRHGQRG